MFNQYRLKRKWGRGVRRASSFVLLRGDDSAVSNMRDFAWHRTKRNPFWLDESNCVDWKFFAKLLILIILLSLTLYLLIYSKFFQINNIGVIGSQKVTTSLIKESVSSVLNYKKYIFCPGNNYFLADSDEIRSVLMEKFPIKSIEVQKQFPNQLLIKLTERIPAVIFDNGYEYSYLDADASVIDALKKVGKDEWIEKTQVTTSTDDNGNEVSDTKVISRIHKPNTGAIYHEFGDYPIVYVENSSSTLSKEAVSVIKVWYDYIAGTNKIKNGYFIINPEIGVLDIKTGGGWYIKTSVKADVNSEISNLEIAMKNKINVNNISYIDLRFPDKMYWK